MGKLAAAVAGVLLRLVVGLGGCVALVAGAGLSPSTGGGSTEGDLGGAASSGGAPAVPAPWPTLEQAAAATCPGLSWSVLGAIGRVESDSGRSNAPGVDS